MASCLGIYVENNIIKYAKVSKTKETLTVDAFGIKVYSDLRETIKQIVTETFSFKDTISINMPEETYNYFYMSSLLNQNDLKKAIDTEFESFCYEKSYNQNALESRFIIVNDLNEKEKIKVIHISENKMKINEILSGFDGTDVSVLTPLAIAIPSITPLNAKENIAIINIEEQASITVVTGQKIYDVIKLDVGSKDILETISSKENSFAKAYQICKNTTIYTMGGKELQSDENNQYLDTIIPVLYKIAQSAKEEFANLLFKINKVYITGTGAVINNVDLYFEEILDNVKCEILKPFFINESSKINIKDYIEVNSALALSLQGLNYGIKNVNFLNVSFSEKLKKMMKVEVGGKKSKDKKSKGLKIKVDTKKVNRWLTGIFAQAIIIIIFYITVSTVISKQIDEKEAKIASVNSNTNQQITAIDSDITKIKEKETSYQTIISNLQKATDELNVKKQYKNTIPTLLNEIMMIIPQEVQLTSIENTSDKKIVIKAQSSKYEQLAIFKSVLKSEGVLDPSTVVSSEAVKSGDTVQIVIEGELP